MDYSRPTRSSLRKPIRLINPDIPSRVSEAYRALRTNIQYYGVDLPLRRILVTSTSPGEGKSTTLANLAIAFAQTGQRVLVIDTDLRLPCLHRMFTISNARGLTNVLLGTVTVDEASQASTFSNLYILPAGAQPPNPSEMLGSGKMKELLMQLCDQYDLILMDSPPILAVTDASVLAGLVDGVVLVIGAGHVNRDAAQRAQSQLETVKARVLGMVLNGSNEGVSADYFGGYYQTRL